MSGRLLVLAAFILGISATEVAAESSASRATDRQSVVLTVYQQNFGLVHEVRKSPELTKDGRLTIGDISEQLLPESVVVRSGSSSRPLGITEQLFRFDKLNVQTLLKAAVGLPVDVLYINEMTGEEKVEEGLLVSEKGPIVKVDGRLRQIPAERIAYRQLPPNLYPEPMLLLKVTDKKLDALAFDYLTKGLSWQADHTVVLPAKGTGAQWEIAAGISNRTGQSFAHSKLLLVAGEPHLLQQARPMAMARQMKEAETAYADAAAPWAVGEYHLYEIGRPVTLAHGDMQQFSIGRFDKVDFDSEFVLEDRLEPWQPQPQDETLAIASIIRIANREKQGLGKPLPGGIARIYRQSEGGTLVFLGEDRLPHVPQGGEARLQVGESFDLTATRMQTEWKRINPDSRGREGIEGAWRITLRNAKKEKRTVKVVERIPGRVEVLEESQPRSGGMGEQAVWYVEVPPEGFRDLSFRLRIYF